jgi:hypothetical protein
VLYTQTAHFSLSYALRFPGFLHGHQPTSTGRMSGHCIYTCKELNFIFLPIINLVPPNTILLLYFSYMRVSLWKTVTIIAIFVSNNALAGSYELYLFQCHKSLRSHLEIRNKWGAVTYCDFVQLHLLTELSRRKIIQIVKKTPLSRSSTTLSYK